MSRLIHNIFSSQVRLCRLVDRKLFGDFSIDGNGKFNELVPDFIADDSSLVDIGGGKTPFFSVEDVRARRLQVAGVDIDEKELQEAHEGAYSEVIVGPIETVRGKADKDYVLAQSVLEHVRNGRESAFGMASFLRPGGKIITFCPCKRAWFARLNTILPESWKRGVLFFVFPAKRERQGFPAFYNGCSPGEMRKNLSDAGIKVTEIRYFFTSSYFMFFFPLYLFWRLLTYPFMRLWPDRYCETFIFIGEKE